MTSSYNSFIIKNNNFVDNYDEMYQKSIDVPWQQDEIAKKFDVKMLRDGLINYFKQEKIKINSICELGCGLGNFLDNLSILSKELYGVDISRVAISKAKKSFPECKFERFDTRKKIKRIFDKNSFDLTIERATLWYAIGGYEMFIENMISLSKKYICFHQNFHHLQKNDFIGHEIFPTPDSFLNYLQERMCVLWVNKYTDYTIKSFWLTVFGIKKG